MKATNSETSVRISLFEPITVVLGPARNGKRNAVTVRQHGQRTARFTFNQSDSDWGNAEGAVKLYLGLTGRGDDGSRWVGGCMADGKFVFVRLQGGAA